MGLMQKNEGRDTERYYPHNPQKLKNKCGYIVCRSSWEKAFARYLDFSPNVVMWSSEDIGIKYPDPIQRFVNGKPKFRTYYPDFIMQTVSGEVFVIEIKPKKETHQPKITSKKSQKTILTEKKTWLVNQSKWKAAALYCEKRGWKFKILTEDELFGKRY